MPSDFRLALTKNDRLEGGYAHDPDDAGGETYRGIARAFWPQWPGWTLVDAAKASPLFPKNLAHDPVLAQHVEDFYRAEFWHPLYDEIRWQDVASELFEAGVNTSQVEAVENLQEGLNGIGFHLAVDGVFGPETLKAVNRARPDDLMIEFRVHQCLHYADLLAAKPARRRFAKSWFRRVLL